MYVDAAPAVFTPSEANPLNPLEVRETSSLVKLNDGESDDDDAYGCHFDNAQVPGSPPAPRKVILESHSTPLNAKVDDIHDQGIFLLLK
jgi:hypothetical protein